MLLCKRLEDVHHESFFGLVDWPIDV
jgi:hypothetical protein